MHKHDPERPFCSFCGLGPAPDRRLVAGPGVCICEQCVAKARQLLGAPDAATTSDRSLGPAWDRLSDAEILEHLPEVSRVGAQLDDQLKRWVLAARERSISWSRIGEALGITRQTAWERFKTMD
ncbi:ClpX C4-type zinc finger protein [Arthrobacter sp. B3I4]|uniref:ClpX C4-type zinc finger protein n=1 Tax=Arthrobacter sp. B3I4 TaxID=3042267 RepID=UPI00277E1A3D|nr:ClpX C4-type zinc finger protein [Arthrobacter sp. B3I4]MDQ0754651.1 hypothetical protein [Arthrobacter sp. B3I4]